MTGIACRVAGSPFRGATRVAAKKASRGSPRRMFPLSRTHSRILEKRLKNNIEISGKESAKW